MKQTYTNIEIILIDDGSYDNTAKICYELAENDSRIKLFNQKNSGVSCSRNKGLKNANGKYVLFVDSDDYVNSEYVEGLVYTAESKNADFVISKVTYDNTDINQNNYSIDFKNCIGNIKEDYYKLQSLNDATWGKLYKLEIIKKHKILFSEPMNFHEDSVFNMDYYMWIDKYFIELESIYYVYRINKDSNLSSSLSMKTFYNRIEHIKHMSVFLNRKHTDDADLSMGQALMGTIRKAGLVQDLPNSYYFFFKRMKAIRVAVNVEYNAKRWKEKLVLLCFRYQIYWPIYLYYKIKFKHTCLQ
jgi:glycosyltransferase involved in cell wall biosynthesis